MSELRDYALSLIDDDDILCIEVEAVLDKADKRIAELEAAAKNPRYTESDWQLLAEAEKLTMESKITALQQDLSARQAANDAHHEQAKIDQDFIRQYQRQVKELQAGMVISRSFANKLEAWADKQFPQATQLSRANHLRIETGELIEAMETGFGDVAEEVGDCMSLLLHIITHGDIDIEAELERKLAINKEREWGEPNDKGFVEHVEAQPQDSDSAE